MHWKITEYSQLPILGYQYASATAIDSIAVIKSTDVSKFERFSNVADGITSKIILYFQESDLLVIVSDTYGFELSIKSAERLRRTENLVQEIISNRKVPKSFRSYPSNANNKTNLVNLYVNNGKKYCENIYAHISLPGKS